jgi:hypothetical protein
MKTVACPGSAYDRLGAEPFSIGHVTPYLLHAVHVKGAETSSTYRAQPGILSQPGTPR